MTDSTSPVPRASRALTTDEFFVDGTFVKRYGHGKTAYLGIHGWSGSHQTFEPIAGVAPEDSTLYAIDMPGYGRSEAPLEWTPAEVQARLVRVIEALPEDLTLLGNCSGAVFGLLAGLQTQQRFRHLVLVDPFAYFPWYFKIFTWPYLGRFFYAVSFQNPLGRLMTNASLASKRTSQTNLTRSFEAANHEGVFQSLQVMRAIGGYTVFSPIQVPVTILFGERTFGAVRRSVELWQQIWPDSAAIELEGAGHLPLQEARDAFCEAAFGPFRGQRSLQK